MKLLHLRLPLLASFSLTLAGCSSDGDNTTNKQAVAPGPSGAAGGTAGIPNTPEMVPPTSGGGAGGATDSMETSMGGDGGTGGTAEPPSGGAGGAIDSMEPSTGGAAMGGDGGAAVDPELAALLLEGVGDHVRPPPYEYGPYAQRRDDVPHGTVEQFTYDEDDEFYPEAPPRGVKVFEPAQYEAGEEVFLTVFLDATASWGYLTDDPDGGKFKTRNVLDNLMAEELIPPFIGVFIGNDGDGGNRQREYGPADDKNVRFFLEAVLPAVSERYGYNFSSDPKKRAIIGTSSGGNAAFTAAWERPDAFHRMMGHSSSFSFGAARAYPDIVRMTEEVKPLRLHLEGGMMDHGQHEVMAAALKEKGYVYQWFNSTDSGHGGPGGHTSFPEGLIWLWRGWDHL